MKSVLLVSFILSLSAACSSTSSETESENLKPEADAPASVSAKPEDAAAEAKPEEAKAESAVAENPAAPAPAPEAAPVASSEKLVFPTTSLLNLRQGPGKSHAVARVAKFGEGISLTGEQKNTWLKTTDGLWVSSLFVADSKPAQVNDPAVESVQQQQPVEQAPAESTEAPAPEEASAPTAP